MRVDETHLSVMWLPLRRMQQCLPLSRSKYFSTFINTLQYKKNVLIIVKWRGTAKVGSIT